MLTSTLCTIKIERVDRPSMSEPINAHVFVLRWVAADPAANCLSCRRGCQVARAARPRACGMFCTLINTRETARKQQDKYHPLMRSSAARSSANACGYPQTHTHKHTHKNGHTRAHTHTRTHTHNHAHQRSPATRHNAVCCISCTIAKGAMDNCFVCLSIAHVPKKFSKSGDALHSYSLPRARHSVTTVRRCSSAYPVGHQPTLVVHDQQTASLLSHK